MKTWKLVSGILSILLLSLYYHAFLILSIILFVVVSFQSCAVGIGNTLGETGEVGGSGGIVLSILMLAGGIVSIATRNAKGKGGNIALVILFGLATFFGFVMAGSYSDLKIWASWCLINAILAVVAIVKSKKTE